MRWITLVGLALALTGCGRGGTSETPATTHGMQLTSPAFEPNDAIPSLYTCDGKDLHPPLLIGGVPSEAQSLALVVDDPDAPSGTFVHWLVWNLSPDTSALQAEELPSGVVEGTTSFGKTGWGGPCPSSGLHHYRFLLYALDIKLELAPGATRADFDQASAGHLLSKATLIGTYSRH